MGRENKAIKTVLQAAIKLSPLMYVLIGATGTYYSLKGELDNAKREIQEHLDEYSHGNWVSGDRLLHPALRASVLKLIEQQLEASNQRLRSEHQGWATEVDSQRRWDRLYDRNPQLAK